MYETLPVELGERSYSIEVGTSLWTQAGTRCREVLGLRQPLLITDSHVAPHYADGVCDSLCAAGYPEPYRVVVPAGEASKSHEQLIRIYDAALSAGLDRGACFLALGGGVIGDLAGYAAATYLRGVDFVQIPTTLLAMVDSAVGGKTGINLPQGKNLIGSFYQPRLVLADIATLATLPCRELASGLAEVVKYGVIWDASLLDALDGKDVHAIAGDEALLQRLVKRSCAIKAEVVRQDEREGGLRAILNFGHTLGHALEQVSGYGVLLHGEAIAIGMVFAARLSEALCGFAPEDTARLIRVLQACGLPVTFPDRSWPALLAAMSRDKKKKAGRVGFVLAEACGKVRYGCLAPDDLLERIWQDGVRGPAV